MSKTSFEEEIEKEGFLFYTNKGTSMLPLIKEGRDVLLIRRKNGRLKKYDIPLYKRENGHYVLHRVMKVRDNDYVLGGDNHYQMETGITDEQIIGVLTEIIRDGRKVDLNSLKYRLYVFIWCRLFVFRIIYLKTRSIMHRIKRKIINCTNSGIFL